MKISFIAGDDGKCHHDNSDRRRAQQGGAEKPLFRNERKGFLTPLDDLLRSARKSKDYRRLQSIPGIGPIHAAELLGTVLTPFRFPTRQQFWKYCGLAVVKRGSSNWVDGPQGLTRKNFERTLGLNKDGNPMMKELFMNAATTGGKTSVFKSWASKYLDQGIAEDLIRVRIARKLSTITLSIWKKGGKFDPTHIVSNPS